MKLKRTCFLGLTLVLELVILFLGLQLLLGEFPFLYSFFDVVKFFLVFWLVSSEKEPSYKICWLVLILSFSVVGVCFFLRLGGLGVSRKEKRELERMVRSGTIVPCPLPDCGCEEEIPLFYYLRNEMNYPCFVGNRTEYFSSGELAFPKMLESLRGAKRYIFLEYFIIDHGVFWGDVLAILKEKQSEGVEIRILYDDAGCLFCLPEDFILLVGQYGIQAQVFHPFTPLMSRKVNQRNHRKLMIVDGVMAFTGGINLADEYINKVSPYGYWKDSVLFIQGSAVWSMTEMFLEMWSYSCGESFSSEGEEKKMVFVPEDVPVFQESGFVMVYNEVPIDFEPVALRVLFLMMTGAKRSIYLTTPYLILDHSTESMLCHLAKAGIDIRMITPGIPDKKLVFQVTRGQYSVLLRAGVRIFEFTSGFVHGKNLIVDGRFATVSSINLDFRSLFLHFEHGVFLCDSSSVVEMESDFLETMSQSREVFLGEESYHVGKEWLRKVLRLFSPLM